LDAYERVLGDAMAGDPTLFAREDYVEEAWRIVDLASALIISTAWSAGFVGSIKKDSIPPIAWS
jgi:glucose-6-phosphate 1-dehydrogenase